MSPSSAGLATAASSMLASAPAAGSAAGWSPWPVVAPPPWPLLPWTVAGLVALVVVVLPDRQRAGRREGHDVDGTETVVRLSQTLLGWWRSSRGRSAPAGGPSPEALSAALTLIALGYRSGLPTWQVLTAVADQSPTSVGRDLRQVAAALQWGAGESEAWASVDAAWAPVARAVTVAQRAGTPPGAALMKAADDVRREHLEHLEVAAAQVGVRLVAPLGLVLLPAFCLTTVVPLVVSLGRHLLTSQ